MKTNFLTNVGIARFSISEEADLFLTSKYLNEVELLNLAGGVPTRDLDEILQVAEYDDSTQSLFFSSESDFFTAERELFWEDGFIDNKLLRVFSTGERIGTFIFLNEIIQARKLDIKLMTVSAAKGLAYNGYYTWARLGYTFNSPDDQNDFNDLIASHGRSEDTITELMKTKDGRDFWKENGFWWEGIFDLSANSENIVSLNNYLTQAGINFSL
jgi:hypothetical protein